MDIIYFPGYCLVYLGYLSPRLSLLFFPIVSGTFISRTLVGKGGVVYGRCVRGSWPGVVVP